jgi:hypothetical protein
MRRYLRFALTRDVTRRDLIALRDLLHAMGHVVALPQDGGKCDIHYLPDDPSSADERKDVRLRAFSHLQDNLHFVQPLDTVVWARAPAPVYDRLNLLCANTSALSDSEIRNVISALVHTLGVVSNCIHNSSQLNGVTSPASILRGDEPSYDVNLLLGFDLANAIKTWTEGSEGSEESEEPGGEKDVDYLRLFVCWRCGGEKPACCFEPVGCRRWGSSVRNTEFIHDHVQRFHQLLGNFECGDAPCCECCSHELTTRRLTTRPMVKRPRVSSCIV